VVLCVRTKKDAILKGTCCSDDVCVCVCVCVGWGGDDADYFLKGSIGKLQKETV